MSDFPFVLAIEGPSCSGKSTLCRGLSGLLDPGSTAFLEDYVDAAGGEHAIPAAPKSIDEVKACLEFYANVDRLRWNSRVLVGHRSAVLDRSPHTLLAHELFNEQRFEKSGHFVDALDALCASTVHWPKIVIYLDVPQSILTERAKSRVGFASSIFANPIYNEVFRSYFVSRLSTTNLSRLIIVDGSVSPDKVLAKVTESVASFFK